MSWLEVLLQFVRDILPLPRIVRSYERGVAFVLGRAQGPLLPGWYWNIPVIRVIEVYPVVEQTVNLTNISITTRDAKPYTISANFNYEVLDAVRAYTQVHELDQSMRNEALKYLHRLARTVTAERLVGSQRALERRIREHLQKKVEAWGVRVIDVGVTDLVQAKQIRVFGELGTR